jgi:putative restriction endonuclease
VTDPSLLIASHIKPWRDSSDTEKLDGYTGLLLAPHVDRLFDRGFISFEDGGEILVARLLDSQVLRAWGLQVPLNVGEFHVRQRDYLAYHRLVVFLDRDVGSSSADV